MQNKSFILQQKYCQLFLNTNILAGNHVMAKIKHIVIVLKCICFNQTILELSCYIQGFGGIPTTNYCSRRIFQQNKICVHERMCMHVMFVLFGFIYLDCA